MGTEIRFLVSYACPHCRAALESRPERGGTWLRCPRCGRASRPPVEALVVADRPSPEPPAAGADALIIGPAPPLQAMTPVAVNRGDDAMEPVDEAGPSVQPGKVVLTTALFVSITMLLFAFLDRSTFGMPVFGAATALFLALLLIPRGNGD